MLFGAQVFLWLMFYSFCGWVYESTLCSLTGKRLVNRGFLNGPICPIYGFGALLVIFTVGNSGNSPVSLFLSSAVLACTLEYFTSWAMEKLFHARWWDYSSMRFQLNGRVCLAGFLVFGTFGLVLVEWVHPWLERKVISLGEPTIWMLTGGLFALSASDVFATVRHVLRLDERLEGIQEEMERLLTEARAHGEHWALEANLAVGEIRHNAEEQRTQWRSRLRERFEERARGERMRALLDRKAFQDRRLMAAFPNLRPHRTEAWETLKHHLRRDKKDTEGKEHEDMQ